MSDAVQDSVNTEMFMTYLRQHFDDIHDVSMRFHHIDHTINGLVEIQMVWEDDVLVSAIEGANETGRPDLTRALIEKLQSWRIDGLQGRFATTLPLRIVLVGSDDPRFPLTGILTGTVVGSNGDPLAGAAIELTPVGNVADTAIRARTNREGLFVRTLIPPGEWILTCTHEGREPVTVESVRITAGEHRRENIVMH